MKKAILVLIASAFVSIASAQDAYFDSIKRIESDKVMNLSTDQIAKIKKLNQEIGPKFRAIGQSNIPGYEKGQRKRALAIEHKDAIMKILTESQIETWESYYGSMRNGEGLRDIVNDNYDTQLDLLEREYEKKKNVIENSSLSKNTKKTELKTLKAAYKIEKECLKNERYNAKKSGLLKE